MVQSPLYMDGRFMSHWLVVVIKNIHSYFIHICTLLELFFFYEMNFVDCVPREIKND